MSTSPGPNNAAQASVPTPQIPSQQNQQPAPKDRLRDFQNSLLNYQNYPENLLLRPSGASYFNLDSYDEPRSFKLEECRFSNLRQYAYLLRENHDFMFQREQEKDVDFDVSVRDAVSKDGKCRYSCSALEQSSNTCSQNQKSSFRGEID
jgi:hypothetical protein